MKKDGKDIYRKPSYTPPRKRINPDEKHKSFLESIPKFLKDNPPDPVKEYFQLICEIGQRGANLDIISLCMFGLHDPSEHNSLITKKNNKVKSISGSFNQTIKIAPLQVTKDIPDELAKIVNQFNEILKEEQDKIERLRKLYLSLFELLEARKFPFAWRPMGLLSPFRGLKKISVKEMGVSKQINKKIVPIVDELIRIGYSDRSAYSITGKLLKSYYPEYWKDSAPDLIRSRYTSLKKKKLP